MKMNSRAQSGFTGFIGATVIGVLVLIFMIFASLYAVSVLNPSTFFTTGSEEANATLALQRNLTSGVSQFGARIPTVFVILGAVFALIAIVLLVKYVRSMNSDMGGGGGL